MNFPDYGRNPIKTRFPSLRCTWVGGERNSCGDIFDGGLSLCFWVGLWMVGRGSVFVVDHRGWYVVVRGMKFL